MLYSYTTTAECIDEMYIAVYDMAVRWPNDIIKNFERTHKI